VRTLRIVGFEPIKAFLSSQSPEICTASPYSSRGSLDLLSVEPDSVCAARAIFIRISPLESNYSGADVRLKYLASIDISIFLVIMSLHLTNYFG
jgi:hypothetical protein